MPSGRDAVQTVQAVYKARSEDAAVRRLTEPATRATLLHPVSLERMVGAAYDVSALGLEGPYQAVCDELRLGPVASAAGDGEEVHASGGRGAVDAVWRGWIVGRAAGGDRTPAAFANAVRRAPATGVAATPNRTPWRLPIVAAILVRDVALPIADVLRESRTIRHDLAALGVETTVAGARGLRAPLLIVWLVPCTPTDRFDRAVAGGVARAEIVRFLAHEGIALVTPSLPAT
jgi:hypothetical protein